MKEEISKKDKHECPFLTMDEAAKYLGLSKATLYSYTSKDLLPYYKLQNRKNYFKKQDLDDFVLNESNKNKSADEIDSEAKEEILKQRKAGRI